MITLNISLARYFTLRFHQLSTQLKDDGHTGGSSPAPPLLANSLGTTVQKPSQWNRPPHSHATGLHRGGYWTWLFISAFFSGELLTATLLHWTDIPVQTSPHCSTSLCYMIGHSTYHYWHSQQRKLNGRLKSCAASGETSRRIKFSSWKDFEHAAFAF